MPTLRLKVKDDSEIHLHVLQKRFEPRVQLQQLHVNKGKIKATCLIEDDISWLHQQWQQEYADIINGMKAELMPWQEVSYEINLIDKNKQYNYHLPQCPQALQDQIFEKIN